MSLNYNGTNVDKVVYNGTELTKVIYNGVVVWEASKYPWYVRPDITASAVDVKFVNKASKLINITVKPQQGVTFDPSESDPNIDNTIEFYLFDSESVTKPWYWIGKLAEPSTIDFYITIKHRRQEEVIETFTVSYTSTPVETTTTTYATAKEVSTDGKFTLYKIEK